ncbi:MAG TPA: hypothetical protein VG637_00650, partial [Actinomycetes bacterium]|nr:hypothetical protein [Actinomycetes bacterium]
MPNVTIEWLPGRTLDQQVGDARDHLALLLEGPARQPLDGDVRHGASSCGYIILPLTEINPAAGPAG